MTSEAWLRLTAYIGERDRIHGRFVAQRVLDLFAERPVGTSLVMRGAEGFGSKQHVRTQRLLTPSEDLPVVITAIDTAQSILALVPLVESLMATGLMTLERVWSPDSTPSDLTRGMRSSDSLKLTMYCGRQERLRGVPAHLAIVELLRREGVAGATAVLAVDGTMHGVRQRAKFFSVNAEVPVAIIAVGRPGSIARALHALNEAIKQPVVTLERVTVCKRDGGPLTYPPVMVDTDPSGLRIWQKLTVYSGEQARHGNQPQYIELMRRLREAGASGATVVRGFWGYHGDDVPHGDVLWSLRRRVPVVTTIIDTQERTAHWLRVVDELTRERGLVTSELVPALRAMGPGRLTGGMVLADRLA